MENDRIAKRAYVGVCAGSCSLGRPRKRWIDTVKDCLKKRDMVIRQARSVWRGFVMRIYYYFGSISQQAALQALYHCGWDGECMERCPGDEPLTLTRCHSFMNPLKGGSPFVAEPTT